MARINRRAEKNRRRHPIERADLKVACRASEWRNHAAIRALGKVSELADQPQLYTICAATLITGILRGDAKLARTGLRMLAAEWLATKAKSFVKHRIDRTRPNRLQPGKSHDTMLNSFPSGHTAGAVAVARAYASEYPKHGALAASIAISVGLIQLPRCKHYVTDIGAGAGIGLAVGSLVAKRSR
jgi:membrane-associated phospholipid phosphatase